MHNAHNQYQPWFNRNCITAKSKPINYMHTMRPLLQQKKPLSLKMHFSQSSVAKFFQDIFCAIFNNEIFPYFIIAYQPFMIQVKLNYVLVSMDWKSKLDVDFAFLNYMHCHLVMPRFFDEQISLIHQLIACIQTDSVIPS